MKTTSLAREAYEEVLRAGSDIHHHLPFLMEHAKGNVMEIGVRQGASTTALLLGVEDHGGHVWSVDKIIWNLFPDNPQWTFIHANSVTEKEHVKTLIPRILDLLVIDGDHSYEAVSSDLWNYGNRAKIIMLHDADNPDYPGVKAAISDYCYSQELGYEIRRHSFGLGVISR